MTITLQRRVLDNAVAQGLRTFTGKQIGLGDVPAEKPTMPYAIVYPMMTTQGMGAWADPEEDRWVLYQILSVGLDHEGCAWMSDKVLQAMVGRDADGVYLLPLVVAGLTVQHRQSDSLGAIVRIGNDLFQTPDSYRVLVGK